MPIYIVRLSKNAQIALRGNSTPQPALSINTFKELTALGLAVLGGGGSKSLQAKLYGPVVPVFWRLSKRVRSNALS
jgi:hypothetical protein